VNKLIEYKLNQ